MIFFCLLQLFPIHWLYRVDSTSGNPSSSASSTSLHTLLSPSGAAGAFYHKDASGVRTPPRPISSLAHTPHSSILSSPIVRDEGDGSSTPKRNGVFWIESDTLHVVLNGEIHSTHIFAQDQGNHHENKSSN